jgi:hypothetical protein
MEPEGSVPRSLEPYHLFRHPEPDQPSPHPRKLLILEEHFNIIFQPISAWAFQVVFSPQVSPTKTPASLLSSPFVPLTSSITFLLILSHE